MEKKYCALQNASMWFRDSDLFKNAKGCKHPPNAILSILLFFCLWGGSLGFGRLLATPLLESLPHGTAIWVSLAASLRKVLICGIQILAFVAWVKFAERREAVTLGLACRHKARTYWGGFLLGVGSMTVITGTLAALGAIQVGVNPRYTMGTLVGAFCVSTVGWMVQSASEELAIRGWLIPTLGNRYSPLTAVLLTGGTFGVIHLLGAGATALSFINLVLSGVFFALYAIRAGTIWGVCGLHFGWNLAQGNLYGLNISGEPSAGSSLLIAAPTGPDVLTGGAFGPEGGCVTTLFLTCAIGLLGLLMHRKHLERIRQ